MIVTRYKFIKIILMILFPLNQIFAQNIDFKSSNFKSDKEGFKQAIKDIKLGDEYLEKGNEAIFARTDAIDFFEKALFYFLKADIFNPNNLELNLKIGNAYLYTNEKYNAFQFLQKAMDMNANEQEGSANIHFYYAIALQLEGRYGDAISQFRIFKKRQSEKRFEPFSDFYKKYIQECESAMELSDETAVLITTRGSDMRLEGDLNYDEVIDIYDLMLLVDFNLGYEGQVNPFFGDINGDGMVNVMDLISLIQMIMGYNQD